MGMPGDAAEPGGNFVARTDEDREIIALPLLTVSSLGAHHLDAVELPKSQIHLRQSHN
jgi:hypothetical protein